MLTGLLGIVTLKESGQLVITFTPSFPPPAVFNPLGIGVLTKPDRIPSGEEYLWLPYIRNEKVPLRNSWFCVKQPSTSDLNQHWTWEGVREKERDFFANTAPWNELEGACLTFLKTENLVRKLGNVVGDLVHKKYVPCFVELAMTKVLTFFFLVELG